MFDTLSDRLQSALGDLRKRGRLDEEAISRAMREIRLALLEADVNFDVVKRLRRARARARARRGGAQEPDARPAGREDRPRRADRAAGRRAPSQLALRQGRRVILLAGLQGSGKTTAAAQARAAAAQGRAASRASSPPTCSARPRSTSSSSSAPRSASPSTARSTHDPVEAAARRASSARRAEGLDAVIVDTAGRLQIDEELMDELERVRDEAKPTNVLLVLDAMTGQEAVNVAKAFQERIDFDGVILTKLDGDARGGAALSVKAVTGKPIKFASIGEKLDALEVVPPRPDGLADPRHGRRAHADRAGRGRRSRTTRQAEMEAPHARGRSSPSTTSCKSYKMLRRMGPLQGVLKMIPGMGKQLEGLDVDEKAARRASRRSSSR